MTGAFEVLEWRDGDVSRRWTKPSAGSNWGDLRGDDKLGRLELSNTREGIAGKSGGASGRTFVLVYPGIIRAGRKQDERRTAFHRSFKAVFAHGGVNFINVLCRARPPFQRRFCQTIWTESFTCSTQPIGTVFVTWRTCWDGHDDGERLRSI